MKPISRRDFSVCLAATGLPALSLAQGAAPVEGKHYLRLAQPLPATPGKIEMEKSGGVFVEQVIRPTGLIDPEIDIRPARAQVDDLLGELIRHLIDQTALFEHALKVIPNGHRHGCRS